MKVTGWTYWENSNYIDIAYNNMKLRSDIMDSVPTKWPKFTADMSNEEKLELSKKMDKHLKEVDEAFKNNIELENAEKLYADIYDTVLNDVRENKYHFTGDAHQNCDFGVPIIDNKYVLQLSTRDWGGLIVEAFPEEFDPDSKYNYVVWAWSGSPEATKDKYKIPDNSLITS